MKRVLFGSLTLLAALALTGPMQAAPARPTVVIDTWSWSGFYLGGNVGYSWGKSDTDVAFATYPGGVPIVPPAGSITSANTKLNGAIAGLQAGYNWQRDKLVFGIEADIQWSGQKGSSDFLCAGTLFGGPCLQSTFTPPGVTGVSLSLDQKLQWFGTLRGRIGTTITPTVLLYGTGGLALGNIKTDAAITGHTALVPVLGTASSSTTKAGWTIGAGVEGVISGKWTGKIEYLYVDYGSVSGNVFVVPGPGLGIQANYSSRITDNIVRIGLNYTFR